MTFVASQSAPILIQELVASFDRTRAQHDLMHLCAPAFAGRRIGTDGHERAHQWLMETVRSAWVILDNLAQGQELAVLAEQLSGQDAVGLVLAQPVGDEGYLGKRVTASSPLSVPIVVVRADLVPSLLSARVRVSVPMRRLFASGAHIARRASTKPCGSSRAGRRMFS